jgi:hypothetical protein
MTSLIHLDAYDDEAKAMIKLQDYLLTFLAGDPISIALMLPVSLG